MTGLIPILFLGLLILIFAGRLLAQQTHRNKKQAATIEDYTEARAALDSVFDETAAIKRIFADEDMGFITRIGTPDVQRFFLRERRDLAIQWLRMTRKQVARLMDLHLKLAGYTYEPSPRFEFKLVVSYWWFVISCKALLVLFWLRGPFEAVRIVRYTLAMAENFSSSFSIRLEKTDPVKLGAGEAPRFI